MLTEKAASINETRDSAAEPPVPNGYKQTEMGVIPEVWNCRLLENEIKEMTDFVAAGSFESLRNNVRVYDSPQFAIYVRLFDLRLGLGHAAQKYVDEESHEFLSKSNLHGNELLIANIGANVGEVLLMPSGLGPATIAPNMIVVRTDDSKLRYDYLFFYIKSDYGQARISELIAGSGHPKINKTDLKKYKVIVPPLAEQRAIAGALSDADALVESLEQLIAKKRQIKQGAMQELLTGKKRLPGFSGEWEEKRLEELAEVRSGGTPSTTQPQFWDGDIPWCTPTDITALRGNKYLSETAKRITVEGLKCSSAEMIPANSIVMTSRATIGECALNTIPVSTNQGFKNFVPIDNVDVEFLYYLLRTKKQDFISLCGGSTFLEISKTQLVIFEVRLPATKAEQAAIAAILSDMDAEIVALEGELTKARLTRQGMMQQLLTGKVRLV